MVNQRIRQPSSCDPSIHAKSSPFTPRPLPVQAPSPQKTKESEIPRFAHDFVNIPVYFAGRTASTQIENFQTHAGTLVQTKLTVGQPDDQYEHEADRIASQVVEQINAPQSVQRRKTIQHQKNNEEDHKLQMKSSLQSPSTAIPVNPKLESAIERSRGSGHSITETIRKPLEHSFQSDFGNVRVHTDAQADQLNRSIQAQAFTTGQDIFFRQGAYTPQSKQGQVLLAHELTHVVQQTQRKSAPTQIQRAKPQGHNPDDFIETAVWQSTNLKSEITRAHRRFKSISDAQYDALLLLDQDGVSGPWTHLNWQDVQSQAAERVLEPSSIDQDLTLLCGVAAVANALADVDPVRYVNKVIEVFRQGKFNGKPIGDQLLKSDRRPVKTVKDPTGDVRIEMPAVDWMLMTAIRQTSNVFFTGYRGGTGDTSFAQLSTPWEVLGWMKDVLGCQAAKHYPSFFWGAMTELEKIAPLAGEIKSGNVIVAMLINAGQLDKDARATWRPVIPNHWIRLLKLNITNQGNDVEMKIFTWADKENLTLSSSEYKHMVFDLVVGVRSASPKLP